MKKEYQVPEVECVSFIPEEEIANSIIEGSMGDRPNPF